MRFNIPISLPKVDQLIDCLTLSSHDSVIDVGCGRGEFLLKTTERRGIRGLGIDNNPDLIASATSAALTRVPPGSYEFKVADAQALPVADGSFAVAMCLGSTHAFGMGDVAFPTALRELTRIVKPGGQFLIGEGYWKQEPNPEYLEMIGEPVGIYRDHAGNVAFAEEQGLVPQYAITSNEDEWDFRMVTSHGYRNKTSGGPR